MPILACMHTFFLIKKKHGLKLPLCLMKASHHGDMGHLRCSFMLQLLNLGKNVVVCVELSVWIWQSRKTSMCPGQELSQYACYLPRLWENCMAQ